MPFKLPKLPLFERRKSANQEMQNLRMWSTEWHKGEGIRTPKACFEFIERFKPRQIENISIRLRESTFVGSALELQIVDEGKKLASIGVFFEEDPRGKNLTIGTIESGINITKEKSALPSTWPKILIRELEEQAKKMGFKFIKFRRPEDNPHMTEALEHMEDGAPEIKRLYDFYYTVMRNNGFEKDSETRFIKQL